MNPSSIGRVGGAGGYPAIRAGIVYAACIQIAAAVISAPDDHFAASPHNCCVILSDSRRIDEGRGSPAIRAWIVSPASIDGAVASIAAPDDHFAAGPRCCMTDSRSRCVG